MIQRIFKLTFLITGIFVFQACYFDKEELLYPSGNECDTTNITYSGTVAPIIENNCNTCHSGIDPFAGIWTDNYDDLKTIVDNGRFWGAISHDPNYSPMPKDRPKLSDCSLLQIDIWIENGALND
jgi:hypothetical protein